MVIVTVLDVLVLDLAELVGVLLGENLLVLDWLDSGVVVVLVYLTVDGFLSLGMLGGADGLVLHGGGDFLVDCGVVLAVLVEEAGNGCLGFIHFDG